MTGNDFRLRFRQCRQVRSSSRLRTPDVCSGSLLLINWPPEVLGQTVKPALEFTPLGVFIRHIEHDKSSFIVAGWDNPVGVCSHQYVKSVRPLNRVNTLLLDEQRSFGNQTLQYTFAFLVTGPKRFVGEQEKARPK